MKTYEVKSNTGSRPSNKRFAFILFLLSIMAYTVMCSFTAGAVDLFKERGIDYPLPTNTASTSSPSAPIPVVQPGFWGAFMDAYGDTFFKVTLVAAALAVFRGLRDRKAIEAKPLPTIGTSDNTALQSKYIINKCQRFILASTAITIIGMLLFPPFHYVREGQEVMAVGYHFGLQFQQASVDREMLRIELATAFLVGGMGMLLFHYRER